MQYKADSPPISSKHPLILVIIALLLLTFIVALLQYSGTIHLFSKPVQQIANGSAGATKGEPRATAQFKNPESSNSPAVSPSSNKSAVGTTTFTGTLLAPSGDFVSSHHVTANTQISSVCTTTSGASCKIIFKNGEIIKSLTEEMSDSNGSVYWNVWTPASLGLFPGNWQIEAIATGGQQTKISIDALSLVVTL